MAKFATLGEVLIDAGRLSEAQRYYNHGIAVVGRPESIQGALEHFQTFHSP